MNTLELDKQFIIIEFTKFELEIIINSLRQVLILISKREFATRTGIQFKYAKFFLEKLNAEKKHNQQKFIIKLEDKDIRLLHSAMNEVCHGLRIENFETIIGCSKNIIKINFNLFHLICTNYQKNYRYREN